MASYENGTSTSTTRNKPEGIDVKEVALYDSGHFVPEERPDAVINEILALDQPNFAENATTPTTRALNRGLK